MRYLRRRGIGMPSSLRGTRPPAGDIPGLVARTNFLYVLRDGSLPRRPFDADPCSSFPENPMGAPARRHPGVLVSIALAIAIPALALSPGRISAQGSDPLLTDRHAVLRIVHLNFDCYKDTIRGRLDRRSNWLPTEIRWGRDPAADSATRRRSSMPTRAPTRSTR